MRALSGLPDAPIPRRYGRWVSRDDFVAYLTDYAERFQIEPELGVRVDAGGPRGGRQLAGGDRRQPEPHGQRTIRTSVVIATGYSRVPAIPDWPGRDRFGNPLTHSADYRNATAVRRPAGTGRRCRQLGVGDRRRTGRGRRLRADVGAHATQHRPAFHAWRAEPTRRSVDEASSGVDHELHCRPRCGASVCPISASTDCRLRGMATRQFLRTRTIPVLDHGFVDHVRAGRITIVAAVDSLTEDEVDLERRAAADARCRHLRHRLQSRSAGPRGSSGRTR